MSKTPYAIDWENREFIELVSANMKVLTEFLNKFDLSIRFKLGRINEKIDRINRQMQYVETQFKSVEDARAQQ